MKKKSVPQTPKTQVAETELTPEFNYETPYPKGGYSECEKWFEKLKFFLKRDPDTAQIYDVNNLIGGFEKNLENPNVILKEFIEEELKNIESEIEMQGQIDVSKEPYCFRVTAGYADENKPVSPFMLGYRYAKNPYTNYKYENGEFAKDPIFNTHLDEERGGTYFSWYSQFYRGMVVTEYQAYLKKKREGESMNETPSKCFKKLVWNGSQKELAELFIELQEKKWITGLNTMNYDLGEIAENICNLFDLTKTKRKKDSDEKKSFYQIIKGEPDNYDKKIRVFPQVYTTQYKKKFNSIKLNNT